MVNQDDIADFMYDSFRCRDYVEQANGINFAVSLRNLVVANTNSLTLQFGNN